MVHLRGSLGDKGNLEDLYVPHLNDISKHEWTINYELKRWKIGTKQETFWKGATRDGFA